MRRPPKKSGLRSRSTSDAPLEERTLSIVRAVLSAPTATFLEHAPADIVRAFVARRPGLRLREDAAGNLLVSLGNPKARAPLVFVAHLDHPGFAVTKVAGRVAFLEFRGGVRLPHARRGAKLAFYEAGGSRAIGKGTLIAAKGGPGAGKAMLASGRARIVSGRAAAGGFTMWDFPAMSLRGGRIVSRCLDDLLGAAAALAALDALHERAPRGVAVQALFTRAEEVGFFGTLEAIRLRTLARGARVLSLETSRAMPHAPQGGGVIVRVGDARSLFDAPLMAVLHSCAKDLAAVDPSFRFQRKLMDGGSCEATPFCAAGYSAGGLALPLGNYHNMAGLDGGAKTIGPESVALSDTLSMVKLLVRLGEISAALTARETASAAWMGPLARAAREALRKAPRLAPPPSSTRALGRASRRRPS